MDVPALPLPPRIRPGTSNPRASLLAPPPVPRTTCERRRVVEAAPSLPGECLPDPCPVGPRVCRLGER